MSSLARVTNVRWLGDRVLRVVFSDGLVRELDFAGVLDGILVTLDSDEAFAKATVDPVSGTVAWPHGIDLDPDVLHGPAVPASGATARVVRQYRLAPATQ